MTKKLLLFLLVALVLAPAASEAVLVPPDSENRPVETVSPVEADDIQKKLAQIVTLEYKEADLVSILRSLSWTYGLNIVTNPDVKGKVTINLSNITVRDALNAILSVNGLAYSLRDGVIYVSAGERESYDFETEVVALKYLSAAEAVNLTRNVLSTKGDVKINEINNNIIVTDYAANIKKAIALLQKIDDPPQQVIIEAKIVDITSTDLRAIGTQWRVQYDPVKGGLFGRNTHTDEKLDASVSFQEQSSSITGGQFVLNTLTLKGLTVTATIDALVRDGKANLLASPSIAVLNGHEARIVIGERFPYKERTQTTSGTTETTRFVDIGTTLRVKPVINDDGFITINVHPEVSSLLASLDAGPRITTREADTTVRIMEGETLIIGGLINRSDNSTQDKTPLLGGIPILGKLFSRKETNREQKELAVFLTPRIVQDSRETKEIYAGMDPQGENRVVIETAVTTQLVEELFQNAYALDRGYGLESVRKKEYLRKTQAVGMYEHIFTEFPVSARAPEAMYNAGMIHFRSREYQKARSLFERLIEKYPKSAFVQKAQKRMARMSTIGKKMKEEIDTIEKRKKRRSAP